MRYRTLTSGDVFVVATTPPAIVDMAAPDSVGAPLSEQDLLLLLAVVREAGARDPLTVHDTTGDANE